MKLISGIKEFYNKMNLQMKIVFWFTLVGFLSRGISVITTPIFTRVLTTSEYGLFSVFYSYYTVIAVIATLNLHLTAIYNALTKQSNPKEEIVSAFQSISLLVSICLCIIAIVFRVQISRLMELPETIVVAMFIGFVFVEPYQLWQVYKRFKYEYKAPVLFSISIVVLTPIISLIAISIIPGNKGVIRVLSYILTSIIIPGLIFYIINYRKSSVFYNNQLWKYAIAFAVPLIPHYLSETLLNQTDKIMINSYFSSSEAGIYNIAFTASSIIQILMSAINSAYIPWQFQRIKEKEYKKLGAVSYAILSGLAIMVMLISLFAPEVVYFLAGEKYTGAVLLIPTLGASVFFNYMYQLFARVEMYCEKKAYTVIATFSATFLNIFLNAVFMPRFGYSFAGVSTLISHILFVIMHFLFCKKVCKECLEGAQIYNSKFMLSISGLVLILMMIVTWSPDTFMVTFIVF